MHRAVGFWVTIAFIFFIPLISLSQVSPSGKPASLVEEQDYAFAYGLFKDGLYQLAATQFDLFLEKYPTSLKRVDASFLTAESRFSQQQFDTAAKLYGKFVKDFPSSRLADDAYLRLGESFMHLDKTDDAVKAFKTILDQFPETELAGEAAYWTGEAFVQAGEYENGIKYYTLAYEQYPKGKLRDYALYALGWTYQTKGDFPRAVEWYQRLKKEFPSSDLTSAGLVRIGECYYYIKEYRKAILELGAAKTAITKEEERGEADYLTGEAYFNLGEYDQARNQYEAFLAAYPEHKLVREVIYALGWSQLKLGNFPQAAQTFDRLAQGSDPLAHAGMFRRGVAEKFAGKRDIAAKTWKRVVERAPEGEFSDNATYESGLLLYEDAKYAEASLLFQKVISNYPESDFLAEAYRMAGECGVALEQYDRAKEWFARALLQSGASFDVQIASTYQLGWSYFKMKRYQEAIQTFTQFLSTFEKHPRAVDARFWRAEAEYQVGEFDEAFSDYDAVRVLPGFAKREEAFYGAAWSLYKQNKFAKAADSFEKLVATFPNGKFLFDARLRLGDSYFFAKDFKKAEGAYRTVIRLHARDASVDYAFYQLGQSLHRSGNLNEAVEQFESLIKEFPTSAMADDAQYAIGWIWFQNKEYVEAIREFQKVLQAYPSSDMVPKAIYSIGDAYYNQKQYASAEKSYREVLRRFPTSPFVGDAISGVQYCLLAQGKQQQALSVIDAFVKEHPEAPSAEALYLRKGDLLYSQKQYEAAIREYRAFIQKYAGSPYTADAFYWMGKSLNAQAKLLDAATMFEKAGSAANGSPKIVSQALLEAAEAFVSLKSYERALLSLSRIEKGFPESGAAADGAFLKGKIFEENGDASEAKNQYDALIRRFGGSLAADKGKVSLAHLNLGENKFTACREIAGQVASTRTDEVGAEAQWLIGFSYTQQQNWQEAITAYLRVRYIFPAHDEWLAKAYLGLGEAYERTNDHRRAREAYKNVLKLERQQQLVTEAQKRLKRLERL